MLSFCVFKWCVRAVCHRSSGRTNWGSSSLQLSTAGKRKREGTLGTNEPMNLPTYLPTYPTNQRGLPHFWNVLEYHRRSATNQLTLSKTQHNGPQRVGTQPTSQPASQPIVTKIRTNNADGRKTEDEIQTNWERSLWTQRSLSNRRTARATLERTNGPAN